MIAVARVAADLLNSGATWIRILTGNTTRFPQQESIGFVRVFSGSMSNRHYLLRYQEEFGRDYSQETNADMTVYKIVYSDVTEKP
jgi:hypothetical protein